METSRPPPPPPPSGDTQPHTTEPDQVQSEHPLKSSPTAAAEEHAEEQRMKQEEASRNNNKTESSKPENSNSAPASSTEKKTGAAADDDEEEKCCTCRCAMMPFIIFGYFLLGIFIFVGLIISFVFIILHGVMRMLHFMFWGMAKMREAVGGVLDVETLQKDHEKQFELDMKEWEHQNKIQKVNKEREDAERKRMGKKPKPDNSDDEIPAPSPYMRICGVCCVFKSGVSCLGMSFNGLAYLWFILAFMFGFSSIAIFTTVFPSCTLRGVNYLSNFRMEYDMDFSKKKQEENEEKKEKERKEKI